MPKVWRAVAVGLGVLGLTGCPSPPKRAPQITPLTVRLLPEVPAATNVAPPKSDAQPPLATPPLPPPSPWTNVPLEAWVSLGRWAEAAGLPKPVRVPSPVGPMFELRTSRGSLALEVGSRAARWNGLECWLGFAPKLTNGEPFVFGVDLLKNVLPLVQDAPRRAPTNPILVLDPGHGGSNSGATNVANQRGEKEFTLDWARRLQRLLATDGWTVRLTRTNDADVSLAERVAFADRLKADLFVSLHFNSASPKTDQAGIETYCLTPTGLPSSLVRDFTDDPQSVFPNNAFDTENLRLALRLHAALVRDAGGTDRGVRRARFMDVLRGQNRPAVLLEGGYLSNPREARLIATAAYRQKLAEAVARGLREFIAEATAATATAAPQPGRLSAGASPHPAAHLPPGSVGDASPGPNSHGR